MFIKHYDLRAENLSNTYFNLWLSYAVLYTIHEINVRSLSYAYGFGFPLNSLYIPLNIRIYLYLTLSRRN